MMWALEITRGDNGYRLDWLEEVDDERGYIRHEEYIEESESDELKAGEELLWRVIEFFSLGGSKHDKERLRITRKMMRRLWWRIVEFFSFRGGKHDKERLRVVREKHDGD